jgi:hypothetical protein
VAASVQLLDRPRVQRLLDEGELERLFVEELGWDRCRTELRLDVDGAPAVLAGIAQKRSFVAFACVSANGALPSYARRAAIERAVAKRVREHLIVFTTAAADHQVWQWTKREIGRPVQRREHAFRRGQRADLLVQKLSRLAFSLEAEEQGITVVDVAGRVRAAFDVDPITKRFYDGFQREHEAFLGEIRGISDEPTRRWYASIMLNRLMFVYFVQQKGFLDGDVEYLQTKLALSRATAKNAYFSDYLCPLFFECLSKPAAERAAAAAERIGRVPYLNGGLFKRHQIETEHPDVKIGDAAFEQVLAFFKAFQWHIDDRPAAEGDEISPDVLGYIFERYVNRAQGAYYTKEDITGYISSFAILARLLAMTARHGPGPQAALARMWDRLRDNPDRYVFATVRHGIDVPLPKGAGSSGTPPPAEIALEAETWPEVLRRRTRCAELRAALRDGLVADPAGCMRENLDLRQLVQDAIEGADDPELLEAFYSAATELTVLDPACGSGAFLFAAMNVLEPIYEGCLDKMGVMVGGGGFADHAPRLERFADILAQSTDHHPSQQYFILKQIALRNLFGVDVMEEAVEICKLRLFLKLIAQVERAQDVEPLPDIDFNVKAGNSLVGFASLAQVERAIGGGRETQFDFGNDLEALRGRANLAAQAFDAFRRSQSGPGSDRGFQDAQKSVLRHQLDGLHAELDRYLARRYGVDPSKPKQYDEWRRAHRPFHWLADFFAIMAGRGFDVVIGNPPYVVYPSAKIDYRVPPGDYETLPCKNLYALVFERSLDLVAQDGVVSFIVPLTVTSSERVSTLQALLRGRGPLYYASFPRRPQTVFDGAEMPVTIVTSLQGGEPTLDSTRVERFYAGERPHLMTTIAYVTHAEVVAGYRLGKLGERSGAGILAKLRASGRTLELLTSRRPEHVLYYQEACRYWAKISLAEPFATKNGVAEFPDHWRKLSFRSKADRRFAFCLLNSSLFYWYYSVFSDCEHINDSLVKGFPLPAAFDAGEFGALASALDKDLRRNAARKEITTRHGDVIAYDELSAAASKALIDEIDAALAAAYGLSANEAEYVRSYDLKYRSPE